MTSICTGRSSVSDPMCTLPALCGRPVSCASIAQAQPENCPWGEELRDEEWRGLDDEALERLLIERWLYRGAMLAAITVTWFGVRGLTGLVDQVTIGVLLALALAAGGVALLMRQQDLKIHRELRRRRRRPR